jgi:hypothetical protein
VSAEPDQPILIGVTLSGLVLEETPDQPLGRWSFRLEKPTLLTEPAILRALGTSTRLDDRCELALIGRQGEPAGDRRKWLSPHEMRSEHGAPARIARQWFANGQYEQWTYEAPERHLTFARKEPHRAPFPFPQNAENR